MTKFYHYYDLAFALPSSDSHLSATSVLFPTKMFFTKIACTLHVFGVNPLVNTKLERAGRSVGRCRTEPIAYTRPTPFFNLYPKAYYPSDICPLIQIYLEAVHRLTNPTSIKSHRSHFMQATTANQESNKYPYLIFLAVTTLLYRHDKV